MAENSPPVLTVTPLGYQRQWFTILGRTLIRVRRGRREGHRFFQLTVGSRVWCTRTQPFPEIGSPNG